ncbi:MAG: hypothetical protein XE04_1521 [Marinimicrobia bacterium 46_43]|nr:MAG: hypothetical protein XE04_1521 [Marinimicrobia bacterium 46_43]HBY18585.1 hypothetical protein [Candidatus Neomarinimicrobiota bacterium]
MIIRIFTILLLAITLMFSATYQEDFIVRPGQTVFSLSHPLVTIESVQWENPADTLRWALDPVEGRWVILDNPETSYTVKIFYSTPDWSLPLRYSSGVRYVPDLFPDKKSPVEIPARSAVPSSGVRTRGTLFRSVQVSTNGQSNVSGGMDLQIRGELLPDVMLSGVISDHETPFDAAMSTQSLEELDQIYLELETPGGNGRLGDLRVSTDWSPFSRYSGHLTGVTATSPAESQGSLTWAGFAGSPSGRFIRREISIRENDQGPYRLLSGSLSSVMIVPGSERVYLNGTRLESSQYLMDYGAAELTFSTGYLLSKEDRVFVEYRYRNEWFPRMSTGGRVGYAGNRWGVHLYALRESDDASRPLDESMTNLSPDSLSSLIEGDYLSTAQSDTNGSYVLSNEGFWLYAGREQGTHEVRFFRENQNGGYIRRYDEDGLPYYEYAPEDPLSQYFPRRPVVFPETLSHLGGDFRMTLWKGIVSGQVTLSQFDRGFGPGTRHQGFGGNWQAELPVARLIFQSTGWSRSEHFVSFEAPESVSLSRDMGFHPGDTLRFNTRNALVYDSDKFHTNLAWQSAGIRVDSLRHRLSFSGSVGKKVALSWEGFRLRDSHWLPYYQAGVTGKVHALYAGWKRTLFEPLGRAYAERNDILRSGIRLSETTGIEYRYREDFEWDGTRFDRYSQKHDLEVRGHFDFREYIRWQGDLTGRLDQRNTRQDFTVLTSNRLQWTIPSISLSGQLTTRINRTSEYRREALFIRVADGMGQYRWDEAYNEYVPDPLGNYVLRREQTNDRLDQVIHASTLNTRWQHRFNKVSLRYRFAGDLEYRSDDLIVFQSLSFTQPRENILLATIRARNDLTLTSSGQNRSLRLATDHVRSQNTRDVHSESLSGKDEGEILWRRRGENGYQEYGFSLGHDRRERFPLGSYSVQNNRRGIQTAFHRTPGGSLDLGISAAYSAIASTFLREDFSTHRLEGEVSGSWSRIPGEFVNGRFGLISVNTEYDQPLPYEVADGLPAGYTLQFMFRYERRLSDMVSLNGTFQYRKRGESQSVTLIRVEARAYL